MWVSDGWKEYELLDTSDGEKLENWAGQILIRPDPQVIWKTDRKINEWKRAVGHYHRSKQGGGAWESFGMKEQWEIHYKDLSFNLKPFSFKHTGLFPEQATNWDFVSRIIKRSKRRLSILNLFAYTGGATISAAKSGASVVHVDSSKGMVAWAKENARLSGLSEAPIRYIVDDCKKFIEREIRRGNRYDGIIMDPPSYGRGPKGEIWKIEDDLYDFIKLTTKLVDKESEFFLINSYTTGLQPAVINYMLNLFLTDRFGGMSVADEIGLRVKNKNLILPCGGAGRWVSNKENLKE